jgi:phosphoribosylpyrophosphate synthetase
MEIDFIAIDDYKGRYNGNNNVSRDIKFFKYYGGKQRAWLQMADYLTDELSKRIKFKGDYHFIRVMGKSEDTDYRLKYAAQFLKNKISNETTSKIKDNVVVIFDDVIYTGKTITKEILKVLPAEPKKIIVATFGISQYFDESKLKDLLNKVYE